MEARYIAGIDPGSKGCFTLMETVTSNILVYPLPETEVDCVNLLQEFAPAIDLIALEKVHAMPGNGSVSMFNFGRGYGLLRGIILTLGIPLIDVTPQCWQKCLGCLSHGDKNVTKSAAQQLFPKIKVTHTTADSILIALWAKQHYDIEKKSVRSVLSDSVKEVEVLACKKEGKKHEKTEKKGGKKK